MNPSFPVAKCVAVQNGRVLGVGNRLEDLKPWIGNLVKEDSTSSNHNQYQIDYTFKEHVLVPGFIEPHSHPLLGGLATSLICLTYEE